MAEMCNNHKLFLVYGIPIYPPIPISEDYTHKVLFVKYDFRSKWEHIKIWYACERLSA